MARHESVDEVHIVPNDDVIIHEDSDTCECCPVWDEENRKDFEDGKASKMIWVHNRLKDNLH